MLVACAILQARGDIAGYMGALLCPYAYLQISARFFLVPYYKDGGNGSWLIDFEPWLVTSILLNCLVGAALATARWARGDGGDSGGPRSRPEGPTR